MKLLAACTMLFAVLAPLEAQRLRVAAFQADVTPKQGEPLIWTTPTTEVHDKLWAKGIVLEQGRERYVLCSVDWCGLGNRSHQLFREKIAAAAGTDASHVAVQSLHQHTAPYVDGDAYDLMEKHGAGLLRFSDASLENLAGGVAAAVKKATAELQPFDRVGTGMAEVDGVASARRLKDPDGKPITRWSTSAKNPELAAAPEGPVDRMIRTVAFAKGDRTILRLYYYATHPQTWCCDGVVSADALGGAREKLEAEEKIPEIYFTGCAGDVTVGKYNDGSPGARVVIERNLLAGMRKASLSTTWKPAGNIAWRTAPVSLPVAPLGTKESLLTKETPDIPRYRAALSLAFAQRKEPLTVSMLSLGDVRILHLPGEPMLEFQRYAQSLGKGLFVAVAGYGNISPGYICTDAAYDEGGYEPSASNTTKGAETALKQALEKLIASGKH